MLQPTLQLVSLHAQAIALLVAVQVYAPPAITISTSMVIMHAVVARLMLNVFNAIPLNLVNVFLLDAQVDSISAQETVWLAHSIVPPVLQAPSAQA